MTIAKPKKVLISGASFAGLSTAYWMIKFGYQVTLVEIAYQLKQGGTPVNILEGTVDIVQRMGMLEQIRANQIHMQSMAFKNAADSTERISYHQKNKEDEPLEYEVERDFLLQLLHHAVKDQALLIFGDTITGLEEKDGKMEVNFKHAAANSYDLVFGCDGIHSIVRRLWFGEEALFSHFLKTYFSITIVNELLIPENTTQMYSEPGKTVMLNAYNNKTDICLAFHSADEIPYNYRDEQQMRGIIMEHFSGSGWRTPELLKKVEESSGFYFDKLCQMKMPCWTKGRVALVGDAGYCPSPAAGRGGSVALDGAAALADAFQKYPADHDLAFKEYDKSFRPFIEGIQSEVIEFGIEALIPLTEAAIQKRYQEGFGF